MKTKTNYLPLQFAISSLKAFMSFITFQDAFKSDNVT